MLTGVAFAAVSWSWNSDKRASLYAASLLGLRGCPIDQSPRAVAKDARAKVVRSANRMRSASTLVRARTRGGGARHAARKIRLALGRGAFVELAYVTRGWRGQCVGGNAEQSAAIVVVVRGSQCRNGAFG